MEKMEKKILIALDDSLHSRNAVRYVLRMAERIRNLRCALFMVQPQVSLFLSDEAQKDMRARSALESARRRNEERANACLEGHRKMMVEAGMAEDRIEIKTRPKKEGMARDIIAEGEEKRYDAIVAGRRGISKMQEMFMGSVTANLIEHSRVIPVWIIDGDVTAESVMVAVDGSESALRAVDHVSFMLSGAADARITFVHVVPRLKSYCTVDFSEEDREIEDVITQGDKRCVESFMVHAYKKLKEAGIEKERIQIKDLPSTLNVGKALVGEAESGGYGTVVFGRRGMSRAFFMGSVSNYLINRMSERALWLVS